MAEIKLELLSLDDIARAIDIVDAVRERAEMIVVNEPYNASIENADWSSVILDGDQATMEWPVLIGCYDGEGEIEMHSKAFAPELLILTEDRLTAWLREQERLREARETDERQRRKEANARRGAIREAEREAKERAEFDRLAAKYGPAPQIMRE